MSLISCPPDVLLIILELIVPVWDPERQAPQTPNSDRRRLAWQHGFEADGETKEHKEAKKTFLSLALTCKNISEAAMMMLYREICLPTASSMVYLLRTLLRTPRLRYYVRSLACAKHMNQFVYEEESRALMLSIDWYICSMCPFERSVFGLAKCEAFCSGTLPYPEANLGNESGDDDPEDYPVNYDPTIPTPPYLVPVIGPSVLASLLCLVPNVTSFCFAPPTGDDTDVHKILRDSLDKAHEISTVDGHPLLVLPRLSTLALYSHAATLTAQWECIWIPFWARFSKAGIRKLKTLQAYMSFEEFNEGTVDVLSDEETEYFQNQDRYILEAKWEALEEFQAFLTGTWGMEWFGIFKLFSQLKRVELTPTKRPMLHQEEFDPDWGTLESGLLQLRTTLEHFRIGGLYTETIVSELGPDGILTCLSQFTCLRHLDIATLALFKNPEQMATFSIAERVPQSLDTIIFREEWLQTDVEDIESGTSDQQLQYSHLVIECLKKIVDDENGLPKLRHLGFQEQLMAWTLGLTAKNLSSLTEGRVTFNAYNDKGLPINLEELSFAPHIEEDGANIPIAGPTSSERVLTSYFTNRDSDGETWSP
ncbi:unnamed protein product [Clonostachys solani]|uniref:Uncharacterized protein n=1 Tax=Clonostachys solani TaxID=160281 RepID=A0A9N9ZA43_9HYPO|nr:unnamed protein product [Clonostachys solani]